MSVKQHADQNSAFIDSCWLHRDSGPFSDLRQCAADYHNYANYTDYADYDNDADYTDYDNFTDYDDYADFLHL
jgi:hypothetical protein